MQAVDLQLAYLSQLRIHSQKALNKQMVDLLQFNGIQEISSKYSYSILSHDAINPDSSMHARVLPWITGNLPEKLPMLILDSLIP